MKVLYSFLLVFVTSSICAQTIKGRVYDANNNPINAANILFKDAANTALIKEFTPVKKGNFTISLKKKYTAIMVEVQINGFVIPTQIIENPEPLKSYNLEFRIENEQKINLKEVVILAKKKGFEIVEDTVKYNVTAYRDGSERKIDDIIKKLPGITVEPNSGRIKYKGKEIETVTLEGDNLFGYNYTVGTKNINVDMVDQVQAVDHYAENPLLKGIEQNDKVSLNLILKKGRLDFSGDITTGVGLFDKGKMAHDDSATLLGITKNFKSFGTLNYNTIGKNTSPFDYSGFNLNPEELRERDINAMKIIPETMFSSALGNERANINNQFFGNFNSIFKIGKHLSIKTNGYYIRDIIVRNELVENQFQINNQSFATSDYTSHIKKPEQYRGDLEIKYTMSKKSSLEYTSRIKEESIATPISILRNEVDVFSSNLTSKDILFKQRLLWTNKFSENKAIQGSFYQATNYRPQKLIISPSVFNSGNGIDTQESAFRKNYLEGTFKFFGSIKKNKYDFNLGSILEENPFNSNLVSENNQISENRFNYVQQSIFLSTNYHFNKGRWRISPGGSFRYLLQKRNDYVVDQSDVQRDFIFEPSLSASYRISTLASLNASMGYKQLYNSEAFLFQNPILVNNRVSYNNTPSLELQKRQHYSLDYTRNDLFNQFEFITDINFQKVKGNFFSNAIITENTTVVNNFFLPEWTNDLTANMRVSKYIPFLESTFKLTSTFNYSNFKNIINSSELRNNEINFFRNELFCKTAFDFAVNFESTSVFQNSVAKSQGQQKQFTNSSFQETFSVLVTPFKRWKWTVSADYFLPNSDDKSIDFLFLSSSFDYQAKQNKWRLGVELKNLFNEKNFEQIQNNDYSTNIFRSTLLPRYFLVTFSWNF
ncbi:hypothetical protein [Flavobacterium sp. DSP2-3-1]|uniref:hypothetical protein n=1 Tax=Flavobacterium sp. DSP2-3-1 TaxID=2804620 RepID=UPI003CF123EF